MALRSHSHSGAPGLSCALSIFTTEPGSQTTQRTKKFYLGRDFDPVKVGVDTSGKSGTYQIDTTLLESSNAGHSFENAPLGNGVIGLLLTDEER